jgi:hypothetical protein
MRIPYTLSSSFGFTLRFPFFQIFLRWFPLELLEFSPTVSKHFKGKVLSTNFTIANVPDVIITSRQRMGGRECDFFAYRQSSQKFA